MANTPIAIERAHMSLGSPPTELEIISSSSSSSRLTPRPPARIQTDGDDASGGGEGDPGEFKRLTDKELHAKIVRSRSLYGIAPDGGEKLRKFVRRLEKELDRRRSAGPSKVETGRRQAVQIPSPGVDDPYAFVPQVENTSNHAPLVDSKATDGGLNLFASTNLEGQGATSTNLGAEKVEPTTSTCSGQKGEDTGKKDKQSQTIGALENYLEFKMNQMQKLVGEVKERPKQEDRFTIEKCVVLLEAIEELTDMEKAKGLKLFKCGLNREIFMTTKSASVRLIWLKSEIYA